MDDQPSTGQTGSDQASNGQPAERYDVVVLGGGIAGLTAGATAAREGASVLVLDAHRIGGRAAVDRMGGDILFNRGAHALQIGGAGMATLNGLGIRPTGAAPPLKDSWAYRDDGEFQLLPVGATSLLRSRALSTMSKVRAGAFLAGLGRIEPANLARVSAAEWVAEHSNGSPDGIKVLTALIRVATYASELETLSAEVAAAQLAAASAAGVMYCDGGFQQFVDALADVGRRDGMVLRTGAPVSSLAEVNDGWRVETDDGTVDAGAVVLAAGGPDVAKRFLGGDPGWGALGPDIAVACLEIATRGVAERRFALGLDSPLYLSTHCPPADLAPPGIRVIHLMRYGVTTSDADRAELTLLARRAGVAAADVVEERFLHRMVVAHAQATPERGGLAGRPSVDVPGRAGAFVAGDWVGPVGHLSDASLASGAEAGRRAAARSRQAAATVSA